MLGPTGVVGSDWSGRVKLKKRLLLLPLLLLLLLLLFLLLVLLFLLLVLLFLLLILLFLLVVLPIHLVSDTVPALQQFSQLPQSSITWPISSPQHCPESPHNAQRQA